MELDILTPRERLSLALRRLYEAAGFRQYHMSRFEEYGLYQENRSFLATGQVLTFTDLDGRLMALKPDVTLSIVKNAPIEEGQCGRFWYHENVYRPSQENRSFREIGQMGLECIGAVGPEDAAQVTSLAAQTIRAAGQGGVLELGHMGFLEGLFLAMGATRTRRQQLLRLLKDRNFHEAKSLTGSQTDLLDRLEDLSGEWKGVLARAREMIAGRKETLGGEFLGSEEMESALGDLETLCASLSRQGFSESVRLDLSMTGDVNYYNGLLLRGFLPGIPEPVLQGGQYDLLTRQFRPGSPENARAIGFGLYLDTLERADSAAAEDRMINVALPKGRLGDQVYNLLASVGYGCPEDYTESRKLVVENPAAGIRYFLVKPSDVAIYVEHGAADVGIVGKDILREHEPDVLELLDTGLGRCRMCVAGPRDFQDDRGRTLRVATKFVNIAKHYFASQGREIDMIKLHGSIELAPILGLSDVIVDIVETGTTLRENGLAVLQEFMPISARLIANRGSYQFKRRAIDTLAEKLREVSAP